MAKTHTYHAKLRAHLCARQQVPMWTHDTTVAAGVLWWQEHHALPKQAQLKSANGLPPIATIYALWRRLRAYQDAILAAIEAQSAPPDPTRTWTLTTSVQAGVQWWQAQGTLPKQYDLGPAQGLPDWVSIQGLYQTLTAYNAAIVQAVRRKERQVSVDPTAALHAGPVACPRCGTVWQSPDRRYHRICSRAGCNNNQQYEDTPWLNGLIVLNTTENLEALQPITPWEDPAWHRPASTQVKSRSRTRENT